MMHSHPHDFVPNSHDVCVTCARRIDAHPTPTMDDAGRCTVCRDDIRWSASTQPNDKAGKSAGRPGRPHGQSTLPAILMALITLLAILPILLAQHDGGRLQHLVSLILG